MKNRTAKLENRAVKMWRTIAMIILQELEKVCRRIRRMVLEPSEWKDPRLPEDHRVRPEVRRDTFMQPTPPPYFVQALEARRLETARHLTNEARIRQLRTALRRESVVQVDCPNLDEVSPPSSIGSPEPDDMRTSE